MICPLCGGEASYSPAFDAFFCPGCDVWLEEACGDPGCPFCANRPAAPSLAFPKHTEQDET